MFENCKKGIWVELIGFDRTKSDYGVQEYLDRMPEKPELVSLLLFSTQMLHTHKGLKEDFLIGDEQCSYYGRPANEERSRQDWSAFELRGLIGEFAKHSVKVLPSFFDMTVTESTAEHLSLRRKKDYWADLHPEVMYINKEGINTRCIFPLKHLADGSLYEDFFADKLIAFLKDYGFAGFHGCDGFGHPRFALCDADFSTDMLTQFSTHTGIILPELSTEKMADFILKKYRKEWTLFHAQRHASFWKKIASRLKKENLLCFLNTCWTRDPHEALFRYGIDYRLLAASGIDGFFAEASAAVLELEGWNDTESSCIEKCRSMLMRIKAMIPDTPIWLLGCIKDGMEQYNALRHAPCRMRTEAYTLFHHFCNFRRCAEGILECLGDGITSGEWQIIDAIRKKAASGNMTDLPCAHILWDNAAFDREFAFYASSPMEERFASSHTLLHELIHAGAVLPSILTTEYILEKSDKKDSLLVIFHPRFLADSSVEKLRKKFTYTVEVGLQKDGSSSAVFFFEEKELFRQEILWQDAEKLQESSSWLTQLSEKHPSTELIKYIASFINEKSSLVLAEKEPEFLRVWCMRNGEKKLRLVAGSEKNVYLNSVIRVKADVKKITALTQDPSLPVRIGKTQEGDSLLYAKIPPCGTILLEAEVE